MDKVRSVVNTADYGEITIHLNDILRQREITRYRMSKLSDTRFEVVNKWCGGKVERIDADILARFCYILDCKPEDLIEYTQPRV